MKPNQFLLDLRVREEEFRLHLEEPFAPKIAQPWFQEKPVLPTEADLLTFERLGAKLLISNLARAFYQWDQRMMKTTSTPAYEDVELYQAISGAFGAAVVMCTLLQVDPIWDLVEEDAKPADDVGTLLEIIWDNSEPADDVTASIALRASLNMFRQADDE